MDYQVSEKIQNTVITTSGICVMFLGTGSALARMLTLENGVLNVHLPKREKTQHPEAVKQISIR